MANSNLVWVDLEMTGLDASKERIIEVAVLITNSDLEVIAEGPNLVVNQPAELLAAMDAWNTEHHGKSGLVERVKASTVTEAQAETEVMKFVRAHTKKGSSPLAGNSIHQDRRFIRRYMPTFDKWLHYRMIDVSTVKELAKRWYIDAYKAAPKKNDSHRAMDDICESIEELRYYRTSVFKQDLPTSADE